MHEWSMFSAHELIEPKSASTSQTACGSAVILRLRSMSPTASPYAAYKLIERDLLQSDRNFRSRWPAALRSLEELANDAGEGTWRPIRRWWSAPMARSRHCAPSN